MSLSTRAAWEIAGWAFAAVALATFSFYIFAIRSMPIASAVTIAVALGSVAGVSGFLAVFALVRRRSSGKGPVLGATRGAGIGVLVLMVAASVHALFTSGSAGVLYSLSGQLGYAFLLCGVPFAVAGAILGRSIDRRMLSARGI
jgi:hypothetical protein